MHYKYDSYFTDSLALELAEETIKENMEKASNIEAVNEDYAFTTKLFCLNET